ASRHAAVSGQLPPSRFTRLFGRARRSQSPVCSDCIPLHSASLPSHAGTSYPLFPSLHTSLSLSLLLVHSFPGQRFFTRYENLNPHSRCLLTSTTHCLSLSCVSPAATVLRLSATCR